MPIQIRDYEPTDETSWLRCRALSFLSTCYHDDVWTKRPTRPAVQLVAMHDEMVVGVLDIEDEADLRSRFSRVYVCRRFSQAVTAR